MSYRKIKAKYDGKIAGLYDLEGTIGKGHYAVVKLARHVFTGEKVAVKVIDKNKLDEVSRAHLFQEVRCMKLVQHPNIVRLYEVIDTQSKLYLILELGDGGDLYDYIMKHDGGLEERMAKIYFHQIVQAIAYCHQLHVVHRDLKPENVVFFNKTGSVKLTDFGFSNKFTPGRKLDTSCGSLAYSAPEILLGDSYDPPAVDVWSLGVILYMLVCGNPPFQEANDGETLIKIMDCQYTIPTRVSLGCQQLIGKMLVRDPSERISLDSILAHQWLNEGVALPLPQRALVCREVLSDDEHSYIVQRIVDGKIASRDDIIHSLERNAYNHITATYYLLAERLLRKRKSSADRSVSVSSPALSPLNVSLPRAKSPDNMTLEEHRLNLQKLLPDSLSSPTASSSPTPAQTMPSAAPLPPPLIKRCSLIQEELAEEDEMDVETNNEPKDCDRQAKTEAVFKEIDEGRQNNPQTSALPWTSPSSVKCLCNVHSSPQLLNQINEEGDDGPKIQTPCLNKPERNLQKRLPLVMRGTSCSSSDASDTDDVPVYQKPRREKLRRSCQQHDSGDQSSDTDASTALGSTSLVYRKDWSRASSHEKLQENTRRLSCDMKRRLSIEEKNQSDLIKEKRRNSISGTVKKSASLILGRAYVVGDNTQDVTFKLNSWNSCSDLSPNVRKIVKSGSLNVRHPTDHMVLGCVLARELRICRSNILKETEAVDRENRPRSRVIHVRANDFSTLVDKFGSTSDDAAKANLVITSDASLRQRVKGDNKLKTDINRNALNMLNQPTIDKPGGSDSQANMAKTKYCSLV